MKAHRIKALVIAVICVITMSIPVYASNSYLDVREEDSHSLITVKDDSETNYYINASTHVGTYIRARSECIDKNVSSAYQYVSPGWARYAYGTSVYAGANYQLCAYGSPASSWHLVGTYCP